MIQPFENETKNRKKRKIDDVKKSTKERKLRTSQNKKRKKKERKEKILILCPFEKDFEEVCEPLPQIPYLINGDTIQLVHFQVNDWREFIEKEGGIRKFRFETFTDKFYDHHDFSAMKNNIWYKGRSYLHNEYIQTALQGHYCETHNKKYGIIYNTDSSHRYLKFEVISQEEVIDLPKEISLETTRIFKEYDEDFALAVDIVFMPGVVQYYTVGSLRRKWSNDQLIEFQERHRDNLINSFTPTKICLYLHLNEFELYNILRIAEIVPDIDDFPILTPGTFLDEYIQFLEISQCTSNDTITFRKHFTSEDFNIFNRLESLGYERSDTSILETFWDNKETLTNEEYLFRTTYNKEDNEVTLSLKKFRGFWPDLTWDYENTVLEEIITILNKIGLHPETDLDVIGQLETVRVYFNHLNKKYPDLYIDIIHDGDKKYIAGTVCFTDNPFIYPNDFDELQRMFTYHARPKITYLNNLINDNPLPTVAFLDLGDISDGFIIERNRYSKEEVQDIIAAKMECWKKNEGIDVEFEF